MILAWYQVTRLVLTSSRLNYIQILLGQDEAVWQWAQLSTANQRAREPGCVLLLIASTLGLSSTGIHSLGT